MHPRSEPAIAVYSAECNITADEVQRFATEDGHPGHVERCPDGTRFSIGSTIFVAGDRWHLWKVGL